MVGGGGSGHVGGRAWAADKAKEERDETCAHGMVWVAAALLLQTLGGLASLFIARLQLRGLRTLLRFGRASMDLRLQLLQQRRQPTTSQCAHDPDVVCAASHLVLRQCGSRMRDQH